MASVDAIGIQSHLSAKLGVPSSSTLKTWVQEIDSAGLALHISELDVKYADWDKSGKYKEKFHAELLGGYLRPLLELQNVRRLGIWGLTDDAHYFANSSKKAKK